MSRMTVGFVVLDGFGRGARIGVSKPVAVVGSGRGADIRFQGRGLARRHFSVSCEGEYWFLEDLGSRSVTLYDGQPVDRREITSDGVIQAGDLRLQLAPLVEEAAAGDVAVDARLGDTTSPSDGALETARDADRGDALQVLVNQFSEPLAFFRELVQNAVDAGSPEVDIGFEYRESEASPDDGVMVISVDDYGAGMDRHIIDTKLTRLFSSSKDNDYTKIGKFGIGFVSVFAPQPDAVCVDTSRGGENWRVLFRKDRTFQRFARDVPVDGTRIRIFKTVPRDEYEAVRKRSREVVSHWCRYLTAIVRVEGEPINQPFAVEGVVTAEYVEEGTRIVAAILGQEQGFTSYYNSGLTLHEGDDGTEYGLAARIDSRFIEHTLTRDNIIRDRNHQKALALLHRLAEGDLTRRLFDRLAEAGGSPSTDVALMAALRMRLDWKAGLPREFRDRPIFPAVGRGPVSIHDCVHAARKQRLLWAGIDSPLGKALAERGFVVVRAASMHDEAIFAVARAALHMPDPVAARFCLPAEGEPAGGEALRTAVLRLLRRHEARVADVAWGRLDTDGSLVADRIAVTMANLSEPEPVDCAQMLGDSLFSKSRVLVLNTGHPAAPDLARLAVFEPELAAYMTTKLFFLRGESDPTLDARLCEEALEERCRTRA